MRWMAERDNLEVEILFIWNDEVSVMSSGHPGCCKAGFLQCWT